MTTPLTCWCGNTALLPFSADYLRCPQCETLVCSEGPGAAPEAEDGYYGKEYWFSHQTGELGMPDILSRARTDLADRVPYWLEKTLAHCSPPGRSLELGCSHGGFSAALRLAGFDATGLELSPWVAEFAHQAFDLPVLVGPVEQQSIPDATYDLGILMDVLEHLPDPPGTLRRLVRALKPGGVVIIQTPEYPEGKTLDELEAAESPFLKMLLPKEHTFLFSRRALLQLLSTVGLGHLTAEPALFAYDQFVFASANPVPTYSPEEAATGGYRRFALALVDLFEQVQRIEQMYQQADRDRAERLEAMTKLDSLLSASEADRAARLERMKELGAELQAKENERAALQVSLKSLKQERADLLDHLEAAQAALERIHGAPLYRLLIRLGLAKRFEANPPIASRKLSRMAVDLTPVRPGGENGGAKWISLELLRQLTRTVAPDVEFILLTADDSHDELAWLDAPNVRRQVAAHKNPPPAQANAPSHRTTLSHRIGERLETLLPRQTFVRVYNAYRGLRQPVKSSSLLRELDTDLLFCPFTAPFYHDPHIPSVIVVYDLQSLYYPQFFSIEETINARRYFEQSCQAASRLVAISEYTRQTILEKGQIEPERVVTIPCTLYSDRARIEPGRAAAVLEKFGLKENGYLFYPANFWPHKNHAMLLTAWGMYRRDHPQSDLKLVLAGAPGERMDAVQYAARRMGLEGSVIFTGYLQGDALTGMLQSSLALIFPSLFEGFGVPVLEAMAFGVPVLCSNVTSLPEIGGEAVLYFDPRRPDEIVSAILKAVDEPELRRKLAEAGLKQAARFGTPVEWARKYMRVLEDAASRAPVGSNWITGVAGDGWLGERAGISYGASDTPRQLELDLEAPAWLPKKAVLVTFHDAATGATQTLRAARGQRTTLRYPLPRRAGEVTLAFNPVAQPAALGIGSDARYLSCKCHTCRVVGRDQAPAILYEFRPGL